MSRRQDIWRVRLKEILDLKRKSGLALSSVSVDPDGALGGDGTSGTPLIVNVDGVTIIINGDNELEVVGTTSGQLIPLVTGAEPLELVSDGAGHLILIPYTP